MIESSSSEAAVVEAVNLKAREDSYRQLGENANRPPEQYCDREYGQKKATVR
ncbi:MAG TPA: hypothetical protein VNI77_11345 [Nitrososphaera sp.]|nr:hypothetical protein [Nitrososphaera sp.]